VRAALALAQREREMDLSHQYLLKSAGAIVGRINLTGIQRLAFNKATLGYRIGQAYAGQGLASRAVALLVDEAFGRLGFWRLEANSRPENLASVRVLQRNGFREYGRATRSMQHQGEWFDQILFERHRTAP
jgi:ribosomal-protein-alanine N-acetyltransferase